MEPAKRQTDPSLTSGTMGNGQGTESWGYSRFHCQSFLMSKTHIFIHVFCVYTLCMDKFPQTDTHRHRILQISWVADEFYTADVVYGSLTEIVL